MQINLDKTNIVIGSIVGVLAIIATLSSYIDIKIRSNINENYLVKFEKLDQSYKSLNARISSQNNKIELIKKSSDKLMSNSSFFEGHKSNNISINFINHQQHREILELYFFHKGYDVYISSLSSSKNSLYNSENNRTLVRFNYDLSKEDLSILFSDLSLTGLLNVSCVHPVSWHGGGNSVEILNIPDNYDCTKIRLGKNVTEKELRMLINTKNETFNPEFPISKSAIEKTTAHFLQLDDIRKGLKLNKDSHNKRTDEAYEKMRYGK